MLLLNSQKSFPFKASLITFQKLNRIQNFTAHENEPLMTALLWGSSPTMSVSWFRRRVVQNAEFWYDSTKPKLCGKYFQIIYDWNGNHSNLKLHHLWNRLWELGEHKSIRWYVRLEELRLLQIFSCHSIKHAGFCTICSSIVLTQGAYVYLFPNVYVTHPTDIFTFQILFHK